MVICVIACIFFREACFLLKISTSGKNFWDTNYLYFYFAFCGRFCSWTSWTAGTRQTWLSWTGNKIRNPYDGHPGADIHWVDIRRTNARINSDDRFLRSSARVLNDIRRMIIVRIAGFPIQIWAGHHLHQDPLLDPYPVHQGEVQQKKSSAPGLIGPQQANCYTRPIGH